MKKKKSICSSRKKQKVLINPKCILPTTEFPVLVNTGLSEHDKASFSNKFISKKDFEN